MILKELKLQIPDEILVTNCYIIVDENTKEAMVIDPGSHPDEIIEMLDLLEANLKYIFLTHCHFDHIAGSPKVKEKKGGSILISREDYNGLHDGYVSLSNKEKIVVEADSRVDDGDIIHVGEIELRVISTPGHTKGGLCLYNEENHLLFSGDTIFAGTWGRTDLPTGSYEEIMNSIKKKILVLPDDVIVYPGHGRSTMIKYEKPIYFGIDFK